MDEESRRARARSFLLGGIVGASAGFATARRRREVERRRRERRLHPPGLAAFEQAPCFLEILEDEGAGVAGPGPATASDSRR